MLSSPSGVWGFDELRKYHTRPLRLNWGPKNVHFGNTHFWKFKELPGKTFYVLRFPLQYLKKGQTVQSSKNAEK